MTASAKNHRPKADAKKADTKKAEVKKADADKPPSSVLVIDIGGSKIKILATGHSEPRKVSSGKKLTPKQMINRVQELAQDWQYDAISVGYPGLVGPSGPRSEPGHLGPGWVGFDFAAAFGLPVRIINDAAMQAVGAYEGGRMFFLGLGTGLGSAFIADNIVVPLELGRMRYGRQGRIGDLLGHEGLRRRGKRAWRRSLKELIVAVTDIFQADYVTLGGGNAKLLRELPHGTRRGNNLTAFRGGFRLWSIGHVLTLTPEDGQAVIPRSRSDWRVI